MNFKRRITLKLKDHTIARFALWKELEPEVTKIFKSYEIDIFDVSYTETTKSVTAEYTNFENYHEAVICVAQFGASKGLLLEQVSVENFETKEVKCQGLIEEYKEKNYEAPKIMRAL